MTTSIKPIQDTKLDIKYKNVEMSTEWYFNSFDFAKYLPSVEPFGEESVFHAELSHEGSHSNNDLPWKIRIGKGGQLYSIKINNSNELIPPQVRAPGRGIASPWNDDCMTSVVQSGEISGDGEYMQHANGFVHGSGMYIRPDLDIENNKPFFNPLLSESFNSLDNSYSCVNLGLMPKPSVNRPDVLFYHKYRDLGAGVLEITYYVYNFGSNHYKWGNFPWFAVSRKNLPDQLQGISGSSYAKKVYRFGDYDIPSTFWLHNGLTDNNKEGNNYAGWMAKTADITKPESSITIGHVNGLRKYGSKDRLLARVGIAGSEERDFQLFNTAWHNFSLPPGQSAFMRTFLVFGNLRHTAEQCYNLVGSVEYGYPEITTNSGTITLYRKTIDGKNILTKQKTDTPVCKVFANPVNNSSPLFLLKNKSTGSHIASNDPFLLCAKTPFANPYPIDHQDYLRFEDRHLYKPYDGKTEWLESLGYVTPFDSDKLSAGYVRLSSLLSNIEYDNGELDAPELLSALKV